LVIGSGPIGEKAKQLIDNTSLVFASQEVKEYTNLVATLQSILKGNEQDKGGEQIMTIEGQEIDNIVPTTEPIITPSVVVAEQKLCPECNEPMEEDECSKCKTKKASEEVIAPIVEASTEVIVPVENATVICQTVETKETTVVAESNSVAVQTVEQTQSVEINTESGETREMNEITIRNSKWTLPQIEEKMAKDETSIIELTAKISELEQALKNKDEEIIKAKDEAVRIERLKVQFGDYVKDFKDEDFANQDKLEIARLRKERDELKSKSTTTETASVVIKEKDLDTGHEDVSASENSDTLVKAIREVRKVKFNK
jgi:outer membrane murein-binding lipoprotein Lpp